VQSNVARRAEQRRKRKKKKKSKQAILAMGTLPHTIMIAFDAQKTWVFNQITGSRALPTQIAA